MCNKKRPLLVLRKGKISVSDLCHLVSIHSVSAASISGAAVIVVSFLFWIPKRPILVEPKCNRVRGRHPSAQILFGKSIQFRESKFVLKRRQFERGNQVLSAFQLHHLHLLRFHIKTDAPGNCRLPVLLAIDATFSCERCFAFQVL